MHTSLLLPALVALLATTLPLTHAAPQVAAGGGVAPALPPPSQYPAVTNAPSLVTAGGTTTANQVDFTQTFAATALGGWDLGPSPKQGVIGLGDIQGEVGKVSSKKKRAAETPAPLRPWGFIGQEVKADVED